MKAAKITEIFYDNEAYIDSYVRAVRNSCICSFRLELAASNCSPSNLACWIQIWKEENWKQSEVSWSSYDCSCCIECSVTLARYGSLVILELGCRRYRSFCHWLSFA